MSEFETTAAGLVLEPIPQGLLLIDKPIDWSSHRVVNMVRRATGVKTVGHTGTLDPFATGLLLILVGRQFTKLQDSYLKQDKTYECQLEFGYQTTTLDLVGEKTLEAQPAEIAALTEQQVFAACKKLVGTYEQQAPAFSAIKIKGMKLYDKALTILKSDASKYADWEHSLPKRTITISRLVMSDWQPQTDSNLPRCRLTIDCSSGTYIRALVRDLGELVGVPATAIALRRTRIGEFGIDQANQPENPETWKWQLGTP